MFFSQELLHLNNFAGMFVINAAFESASVYRLRSTFKVSGEYKQRNCPKRGEVSVYEGTLSKGECPSYRVCGGGGSDEFFVVVGRRHSTRRGTKCWRI